MLIIYQAGISIFQKGMHPRWNVEPTADKGRREACLMEGRKVRNRILLRHGPGRRDRKRMVEGILYSRLEVCVDAGFLVC